MNATTIGIDLAKRVFAIHGIDAHGKVVFRKALRREQLVPFFTRLQPCTIAMEACGSSHYWARKLNSLGHNVRLIAPQFVKPYVQGNKHDAADAAAICEAATRPCMRYVPIKTAEAQAVLALHRTRACSHYAAWLYTLVMEITEAQYQQIEHCLPRQRGNVSMSNLQVLNAILYVAEHGCKWRGLPKRFGRWHTVYTRMNRWSRSGVLDRVFKELQRAQIIRIKIEAVSLDSTVVKVHPDGTGALKKTGHKPLANPAADGAPKFIWLPRMLEQP